MATVALAQLQLAARELQSAIPESVSGGDFGGVNLATDRLRAVEDALQAVEADPDGANDRASALAGVRQQLSQLPAEINQLAEAATVVGSGGGNDAQGDLADALQQAEVLAATVRQRVEAVVDGVDRAAGL